MHSILHISLHLAVTLPYKMNFNAHFIIQCTAFGHNCIMHYCTEFSHICAFGHIIDAQTLNISMHTAVRLGKTHFVLCIRAVQCSAVHLGITQRALSSASLTMGALSAVMKFIVIL